MIDKKTERILKMIETLSFQLLYCKILILNSETNEEPLWLYIKTSTSFISILARYDYDTSELTRQVY